MAELQVLDFDKWTKKPIESVKNGDTFRLEGHIFKCMGEASKKDDGWHVPGKRTDNGPITLAVGERYSNIQAIVMVMDFCMSTLHEFEDGTCMIASLESGPGFIFTPRLPEAELNEFCEKHLDYYENFFHDNEDANDSGKPTPMDRFWE